MNPANVGMLINHQEIDHLITAMSDSLRNAAYKVANQIAPKDSPKYHEYFDEDGTLRGYDMDSNKALIRDCLDHYVQYSNAFGAMERTDFNYYLESNFEMVRGYVNANPEIMAYLTSLFARACGILSSVLEPVMENIINRGQIIDRIESFVTGPENTYYLVYGEDIDNQESYDPKEDDLSDVDCTQTPEELAKLEQRAKARELNNLLDGYNRNPNNADAVKMILSQPVHPHIGSDQYHKLNKIDTSAIDTVLNTQPATINQPIPLPDESGRINLVWNAPGTELL